MIRCTCRAILMMTIVNLAAIGDASVQIKHKYEVQGATVQPRLAFIIGVSDYDKDGAIHPDTNPIPLRGQHYLNDLTNPIKDAEAIAHKMRALGFFVYAIYNPDRNQLLEAAEYFRKVVQRAGPHAISITYFAGHGVQVNGANYVLPAKAVLHLERLPQRSIDVDATIMAEGIATRDLLFGGADAAPDSAHLLILDACRNNPWREALSRLGYARKAGLVDEAISAPRSMIIFSTAPGAYAYDGVDGNSPFAAALLNSLSVIAIDENADRDIETGIANTDANRVGAIKRAMMQVARDSDGEQTPYMNGPALDEVCLSACTYVTRDQARTILANGGYVTGSVQGALDWAADEQEQIYLWRSPSREDSDSELLWLTKPLPAWTGGFSEEIPQPAGIGELESTPP